ncbi:MAG: helix-turn-helix transcriptional regulator [Agathobacter sp.]|nr:helix-turn-helix transcriptional regulator [Agathobacter sp.]
MVLLGRKIKELRNKYRFTQTELANQVGVTKSTIAAYENDSRLPSYDVLIKLADVFKVSIDSLLLNRSEVILDAEGLTLEQLQILESLIMNFRKSNKNRMD